MARVTRVKKAQQRYEMVPVRDAEGNVVKTPVMNKRTGEQKVTKTGKPVFMTQSVVDKTKPKPDLSCDFPGCDINGGKIAVGTPYMHITPKSGPYGGTQKNRHAEHPSWNIWEYSYSASANVARIQNDMSEAITVAEFTEEGDFDSLKEELAAMAEDFQSEKQDSLDGMPEGLADGSQLQEQVEALESWVEAINDADAPDFPDPEEVERWYVVNIDGSGDVLEEGFEAEDEAITAMEILIEQGAAAEGEVEVESREEAPDEPTEEQIDEWADECRSALEDAINECEL